MVWMDGVDGWMVLVDGWVAWMVWMNGWCGWMVWMGGVDGWTDDVGGWLSLTLFLISYKRRGEREGDEIKKTSNCRTSASGQTPCHHATQQYTNRCFADLHNSQPESSVSCVDLRSAVWISGQLCGSQVSCVNHRDTVQQGPDFSGPLFAMYRHCPWLNFP